MYDTLAQYYDNSQRNQFSETMVAVTLEALKVGGIQPPGPLLDMACGTGIMCAGLAKAGWEVIAVDQSQAMLDIARQRAKGLAPAVTFHQADIRALALEQPVKTVLCFGDVVNHLLEPEDVQRMMQCAFNALVPGGLFLLDANTLETYQSSLWNLDNAKVKDLNVTTVYNARFDASTGRGEMEVAVEARTGRGRERKKDVLVEQYYAEEQLKEWLNQAGFVEIQCLPFNPVDITALVPGLEHLKTFWRCQKPTPQQ